MKADAIGLYLHVPFCVRKCNYCDFCSFSNLTESTRNQYISKLVNEIKSYRREERIAVDSIFFGGGTPSLLSCEELSKLYSAIDESFKISNDTEFTLEANPKTLTRDKLAVMREIGVNRLSIGLQTIHENERKILGRIHDYNDFLHAYGLARECGINNIGVDVMYGIPEQTIDSFEKTLRAVVSLSPEHVSAYGLILEEETPFWNNRDKLHLPNENDEIGMYFLGCDMLAEEGYSHYEISNYAKVGKESAHNLKYWQNQEYIGVGISAYSYFNGVRYGNTKRMDEYLSMNFSDSKSGELIDTHAYAEEYLLLGLRLKSGISLKRYESLTGTNILASNTALINEYVAGDYLRIDGDNISLTEKGFYVSNTIISSLL